MRTTLLGQEIAYTDTGQGTPLLMLHAFPLHGGMYGPVALALSRAARLITIDMPGMGESTVADDVSMEKQAALAVSLLDDLGIERAIVGGVSMGGYATFAAWRAYRERISGLILADTKPEADTPEAQATRAETAQTARKQGSSPIAEAMLPKLVGATTQADRPEVCEQVRTMIESASGETIAQYLEALAARPDSTGLLSEITVPTLVMAGTEDEITPAEAARSWSSQIPHASYVQLDAAGHLPCLETPKAFSTAITNWLNQNQA